MATDKKAQTDKAGRDSTQAPGAPDADALSVAGSSPLADRGPASALSCPNASEDAPSDRLLASFAGASEDYCLPLSLVRENTLTGTVIVHDANGVCVLDTTTPAKGGPCDFDCYVVDAINCAPVLAREIRRLRIENDALRTEKAQRHQAALDAVRAADRPSDDHVTGSTQQDFAGNLIFVPDPPAAAPSSGQAEERRIEERLVVTDLCDMHAFHKEGRLGEVLRRAINFIEGCECFPNYAKKCPACFAEKPCPSHVCEHPDRAADGSSAATATNEKGKAT